MLFKTTFPKHSDLNRIFLHSDGKVCFFFLVWAFCPPPAAKITWGWDGLFLFLFFFFVFFLCGHKGPPQRRNAVGLRWFVFEWPIRYMFLSVNSFPRYAFTTQLSACGLASSHLHYHHHDRIITSCKSLFKVVTRPTINFALIPDPSWSHVN